MSSGMPASLDTTRSTSVICDAPLLGSSRRPEDRACHHSQLHHRSTAHDAKGCQSGADSNPDNGLVTCPVNDCRLVCAGCESLCEHLKECHLPDCKSINSAFLSHVGGDWWISFLSALKKPVRLIYACPVKTLWDILCRRSSFWGPLRRTPW